MIHPKVMKLKSRDYNNIQHLSEMAEPFRTRDIPRMAELLTDNIKINSLTFDPIMVSRKQVNTDELFEAFPDIKINPVTITTDNRKNRVLTEMDVHQWTQRERLGQLPDLVRNFGLEGYSYMTLWDTRLRKSGCIMTPVF